MAKKMMKKTPMKKTGKKMTPMMNKSAMKRKKK